MAEDEKELNSLLMRVKEESKKVGFKLNILKTKNRASGPMTSWQIDKETIETVTDYFLGLQNSEDGDRSHEIKGHLLLGRKAMTNINSVLKSRVIILLKKKFSIVKAMVFPVVMYGSESWTIKKTDS